MSASFWNGKRVFITGHTGFKGAWLTLWLRSLGAEVTGFALDPPTSPSLFAAADVAAGIDHRRGDVRDLGALRAAVVDSRADVVFHMAAQSLVRASYDTPVETYATNVMGTVHLLEAVRQSPSTRAVVVVTSDKCYENREWVWGYRESDAMGGHDPYSNSKGCAELVTAAYRDSFFTNGAVRAAAIGSGRAGNVIGGGDWAKDRLIPDIMTALSHGKPVVIRNPHAIRPWQHVLEPLSGYLRLAERLCDGESSMQSGWNFGPHEGDVRPVSWVVEQLCATWGGAASWELDGAEHPHEAHYLRLDCAKASTLLGWSPRLTLAEALAWTAEWYREFFRDAGAARELTLRQIADYERRDASGAPAAAPSFLKTQERVPAQ